MNEEQRSASTLIGAGLSAMREGSGALRTSDTALEVGPTRSSNVWWFMRAFVARRPKSNVGAVEKFWTNLEVARDQFVACDSALTVLFREHGDLAEVLQLQTELGAAGYDRVGPALQANVEPGAEIEACEQLRPTVARMRLCENRMLAAIQALATNG
jgi:hypothetical protein